MCSNYFYLIHLEGAYDTFKRKNNGLEGVEAPPYIFVS